MNYRICYGYVTPQKKFYVTDLFYKQIYDYMENQKDFVFHRRWGDRHNCQTSVGYKNVRFFGTHYRKTFWEICVYGTNLSHFIERKNNVFTYGTYDYETKTREEISIDLSATNSPSIPNSEEPKESEARTKLLVEETVNRMLQTYSDLFSEISGKGEFIEFLTENCNDIICGEETEEEIQEYVIEGQHFFEFYVDIEKFNEYLKREVDLQYILNKFPYLNEYIDKIDVCSILNKEKEYPSECTVEDWIKHFKEVVDKEISRYLFVTNISKYTVEFFLDKYSNLIDGIQDKKEFLENFEKELDSFKSLSRDEPTLFDKVERYIHDYVIFESYSTFVKEYGQDTYTIELTEQKESLFNSDLDLNALSAEEQKQISLYRELKEVQTKEMYNKNGKTIKASFSSMPKLISITENMITVLEKLNIISLKGDEYNFVSFKQIDEFITLVKDMAIS